MRSGPHVLRQRRGHGQSTRWSNPPVEQRKVVDSKIDTHVEEIITGHARLHENNWVNITFQKAQKKPYLSWNTGGNHNNLDTFQSLVELVGCVTCDLHVITTSQQLDRRVNAWQTYLTASVDVAHIGSNTGSTTDIIQTQGCDQWITFKEQRQRLTNSSASAEDCNFCSTGSR